MSFLKSQMIEQIKKQAEQAVSTCQNLLEVNSCRQQFLGKGAKLNDLMKQMSSLPIEEKKEFGAKVNKLRAEIEQLLSEKKTEIEVKLQQQNFEKEKLDLTSPARSRQFGSIHPISQVLEELTQVLSKYGFTSKDGPDIEDDWHNFTALNIGENHPARQMHDTFYLKGKSAKDGSHLVLRTHTSTVQIRTMETGKPPFRFIAPGRTYRSDSDMTHTPMFHQIEGLVVDEGITMAHLKFVITDLIKSFFERDDIEIQLRPSFFPFTEPSAEVDIRMSKNDKWLEVLGCGMVHPNVLKNVGINPDKYQGFAFGIGLERFAMLKYNIKDLRKFFEGDKRWLDHYNFKYFDIPSLAGGLTR